MVDWDGKVWALTGVQPVELKPAHLLRPISILLVQRGHQLATKLVGLQVQVDALDSTGALIRSFGLFDIQDERSIRREIVLEGVTCLLELTWTTFVRKTPLLTGILCPQNGDATGDESAVGGFSAEAQAGYGGAAGS
jgi:hypothetical protein